MKVTILRPAAASAVACSLMAIANGCMPRINAKVPANEALTVSLIASPPFIERGQVATLSWSSTNATDLNIAPEIGIVGPHGAAGVFPTLTTTYVITARGPGGTATASATVIVNTRQVNQSFLQ